MVLWAVAGPRQELFRPVKCVKSVTEKNEADEKTRRAMWKPDSS